MNTVEVFPLAAGGSVARGCLILVQGNLNHERAAELHDRLQWSIERGAREVVVRFRDPMVVDTTTIGVMLAGNRRLVRKGGRLTVECEDATLLSLLKQTGVDRILSIYRTFQEETSIRLAAGVEEPGDDLMREAAALVASLHVAPDTVERWRSAAAARGVSLSELVQQALEAKVPAPASVAA